MPVANSRLEIMQVCKVLQCVREKNYIQIEKLVMNGVPGLINYTEPEEGDSPLIIAAVANDEETIKFLLELGAHPDVVDLQGRTAIMRAAEFGHIESFEALAKAGANLKTTDLKGRGVLFYCISPTERHAKCIEIALQHNADVNTRAKDGRSVFFAACETAKDNEDTCIALLEKGADPNVEQTATGRTALMMAAQSGSAKVVRETLRRGADVNIADKFGRTAAHEAARCGHFQVLVCLGGHGCNFDVYDNKGSNPIHLAANGHAMACKYLGQRGCNPKPKNNDGFLAKNIAKDNGHKDCMKELRKVEKTFGKIGKNNEPWALALYDWSIVRADELIESFKKFDPDEVGLIPKDDFADAVKSNGGPWNDEAEKKILLTYDKNKDGRVAYKDFLDGKKYVNKNYLMASFEGKKKKKKKGGRGGKKKKGKPPMDICVMPAEEIMRTLDGGPPIMYIPKHANHTDHDRFNRDKPPQHPLQDDSVWYLNNPEKQYVNMNDAAKFGDLDSIRNALRRGYSVDTRDKYYKTPLMMACQRGNLEMAKALIDYGANVNAKDNFHWTPMHHACHAGMLDVVELLFNNGAAIDCTAMNGATPMNRAIESSKLNVVQFLMAKGAKLQNETRKGANPMDVAYTWADPRVIDTIKTKFDTLPQAGDKKGGKGGKKGGGRPKTAPGSGKSKTGDGGSKGAGGAQAPASPTEEQLHARRKASILRAASALAAGLEEREDITYCPRKPWLSMATTEDLLYDRQVRRERFGWEVDFDDFEMPFQQNTSRRVAEMDDDDL